LAKKMWHCPTCGAAPIDIFPAPFGVDLPKMTQMVTGLGQGATTRAIFYMRVRIMKLWMDY